MESLEHIGFLVHYGDKGFDVPSLSQATPFFANSDPDMPAVPVPASQVNDWLLKDIASALESISNRISGKENGASNASDQNAAMADSSVALNKVSSNDRGPCIIEGVSKTSLFKQASDLKGRSVKVRIEQLICILNSNPSFSFVYSCMHVNCMFCVFCRLPIAMILLFIC
jgi:TBCC domain-containing protein 1